jgi:hypothetical protein
VTNTIPAELTTTTALVVLTAEWTHTHTHTAELTITTVLAVSSAEQITLPGLLAGVSPNLI